MSKFRSDIQGLRAFAVMSVVLFHFNPEWLKGGFIGVDIFFVISGYLMTTIVINGIEEGRFSLLNFYLARVVRIVPALLLLCITASTLGFLLLNLIDASNLVIHAASSLTFLSNFVYWSESGYFDDASKYNWLLHTWSLSVEWQFYIFYPLVMLLLSSFFSVKTIGKFTLIAITLGLGLSVWAAETMPSAAYFMLPTRAWELLMGGMAFFYPLSSTTSQKAKSLLQYLGLTVLILSALLLNENFAWPGAFALFPVVGTLLVILARDQNSILTGNAVAQKIGKWSYSIYLWHWPVVVFINYFELPSWAWLPGLVVTFYLGWLSYEYCESKFSKTAIKGKQFSAKHVFMLFTPILTIMLCFVFFKTYMYQQDLEKIEPFLPGQNYFVNEHLLDANGVSSYFLNSATENDFDFLALGDSNLSHYVYGIENTSDKKIILSWAGACLSLPNYITKPTQRYMNRNWVNYCKDNFRNIKRYPDKPIILAHQWEERDMLCTNEPCNIDPNKENYFDLLDQQLMALINYAGLNRPFIIIGQVPAPSVSVYKCMKGFSTDDCPRTSDESKNDRVKINAFLTDFSYKHKNVMFINPYDAVCDNALTCQTIINNKSLFHDEGHLSAFGSKYFWAYISSEIDKKLPNVLAH